MGRSSSSHVAWIVAVTAVAIWIGNQVSLVSSCSYPSDINQPTTKRCKFGKSTKCCSGSCQIISNKFRTAKCLCGRSKYNSIQTCKQHQDCCSDQKCQNGYCGCQDGGAKCSYGAECCTGRCRGRECTSCKEVGDGICSSDQDCCEGLRCAKGSNGGCYEV